MKLIIILITILSERYLRFLQGQNFRWFTNLVNTLRQRLTHVPNSDGPTGVVLVLAPALLFFVLVWLIALKIHPALGFILSLLVLLYTLQARDLREKGKAYVKALRDDDELAGKEALHRLLGSDHDLPEDANECTRIATSAILARANDQVFAVIFWFAVLGPFGALLYRLSRVLRNEMILTNPNGDFTQSSRQLHSILAWLPARLLCLSYGITGSFTDALHRWRGCEQDLEGVWADKNEEVLSCAGIGALQLPPAEEQLDADGLVNEINAAMDLVIRTLLVWVTIIAVMTLVGWAA